MEYIKHSFRPTEFHTHEYKSRHTYSLQNELLKERNFPLFYYKTQDGERGDFTEGFYEDRTWSWQGFWNNALGDLESGIRKRVVPLLEHGRIGFANISAPDMAALLQAKYPDKNIVGFRLIRYTNVSNGFPCDYLECFGKSEDTPEMEFGLNIAYNDCPEAKRAGHHTLRRPIPQKP